MVRRGAGPADGSVAVAPVVVDVAGPVVEQVPAALSFGDDVREDRGDVAVDLPAGAGDRGAHPHHLAAAVDRASSAPAPVLCAAAHGFLLVVVTGR